MAEMVSIDDQRPVALAKARPPVWIAALALLVVLSLGATLKVATSGNNWTDGRDQSARVALFLNQHRFVVAPTRIKMSLLPGIAAIDPTGCEVIVLQPRPFGWEEGSVRERARPGDELFYLFEGALYESHPIWRQKMYHNWDRARRHLGYPMPSRPLLAIISPSGCAKRKLPWQDLF